MYKGQNGKLDNVERISHNSELREGVIRSLFWGLFVLGISYYIDLGGEMKTYGLKEESWMQLNRPHGKKPLTNSHNASSTNDAYNFTSY